MQDVSPSRVPIRFSEFEIDLCAGELRKHGVKVKLQEQPFQILQALLERPGEVVSREELRQRIWPSDTFVDFDHGLYNAIKRLREALGDSADAPRFIETLPKRGYKFIATVESPPVPPQPELAVPEDEPAPPKQPKLLWWKRKTTIGIAACMVLAGLLYPWIAPQSERLLRLYELQQLTPVPLTASPGVVWSPSFSPDGSQISFIWFDGKTNDLYVKAIGNDTPLRLTHEPFGVEAAAWSPNGKSIALCQGTGPDGSAVFLISPLGGPERKLTSTSCTKGSALGGALSWSADGNQLAFLHSPSQSDDPIGLFVLSLDSREAVPVKTDCQTVILPAFSPRGDQLAWACADNLSNVPVYLQRLSDGKVTKLLQGVHGIGGLAWSEDGRRIVFSTGFWSGELWEVALDRPNHPQKLPFGHDANDLAVSFAGHRLAYSQTHVNQNIWRVDLSNPQAHARKVVASSRDQTSPEYSPDGTHIAFESDRSGSNEVWVSDADGSNAIQLSLFGIRMTGMPQWSPDGKMIVFHSWAAGEANIYLVDPHGGVPRKLDVDVHSNSMPSWSHDGKWIYFTNGGDAHHPTVWKVPPDGGHAVQIARDSAMLPVESPDAQRVYFVRQNRLWSVNTDGSDEKQVAGMPELDYSLHWAPFGSGIYFVRPAENNKWVIDFFDLKTKQVRPVFVLEKFPAGWRGGLSISNDGKWLLFSQNDDISSDLMLVENWR